MQCILCNQEKSLDDFYYRKDNKKHRSSCKECDKNRTRKSYLVNKDNPEFIKKESLRKKIHYSKFHKTSLFNRKTDYLENENHKIKFPEKYIAVGATKKIRKEGFHAHHWSYIKEHHKDVIYLTPKEHMVAHRFIVYDQERMMYRRYDTNELLDTKEKHYSFISYCIINKED